MTLNPEIKEKMDRAADVAAEDFFDNVAKGSAADVANWAARHYLSAGYKNLSRILVGWAKDKE